MPAGRPKVDDLRDFRVNLRLSSEERALLEAYAEKYHLKKTQVFMRGFYELLEREEKSEKNK